MRTSSSQAEGAEREFQAATLAHRGQEGPRQRREVRPRRREAPADRRHASSSCRPTWSSSPSALPAPCTTGSDRGSRASTSTRAATCSPTTATTGPRATRSSLPATCGAASRWSSGRSAKAGRPPAPSTRQLMGVEPPAALSACRRRSPGIRLAGHGPFERPQGFDERRECLAQSLQVLVAPRAIEIEAVAVSDAVPESLDFGQGCGRRTSRSGGRMPRMSASIWSSRS